MNNLSDINLVKKILLNNNFKFSKSLGQNFIVDDTICPKMANSFSEDTEGIIEIGPGIGTLSYELAKKFKKLVSIELDKRLIPILKENLSEFNNIEIIQNDILKTDINNIINIHFKNFKKISICANLPYYITSEVIMYILENNFPIDSIVVMVQKEFADRICAKLGTRASGAISVAIRYFGDPEIIFDVNKTCFIPVPNVDSSVIRIKVNNKDKNINNTNFFKVVKASFSNRRKNILNSLSGGLKISKSDCKNILDKASIDTNLRAENLNFENFVCLSNLI